MDGARHFDGFAVNFTLCFLRGEGCMVRGQRLAQTTWSKREVGWATETLSALEKVAWLAHLLGWPWTGLLNSFSSVNPAGKFVWGRRNTKMTLKSKLCPCIALSRVNKSYPNIPPSLPSGVFNMSFVVPCGKAWMQHELHKWYSCIFRCSSSLKIRVQYWLLYHLWAFC